jgi:hypothetical protein
MRKLNSYEESIPFTNLLKLIPDSKRCNFVEWLKLIPDNLKPSRVKALTQIVKTNGWETALELYLEYYSITSKKEEFI